MDPSDASRNIQDYELQVSRALPAAAGSVTSADLLLGNADFPYPEGFRFGVRLPAISAAILPAGIDLTIELLNGSSASPTTVISTKVVTGVATVGLPAQVVELPFSRNADPIFAVKYTTAATSGDASGLAALSGPLF